MGVAAVGILGGPFKTTTGASSYVFSPSTPANSPAVVLLGVASRETSTVADPSSVTGLGLTWTKIVSQHEAGDVLAASLWLGVGTPSAGNVTINFPAAQTCCFAHFLELSGAPQSSTIVQSLGGASTGSPLTITLSSTPTSGFVVGFVAHRANEATTPGSGFTEASDDNTSSPANTGVELEWQAANDQTVDWTYSTASNATGVAAEVAAAAGGGSTGTAAWTEDADTWAAAGTTTVTGTAAWTEAADTWAAAGTTTVTGSSSWTEAADTWAAAGTTTVRGPAAWTETADTWAGTGGPAGTGSGAWTEAADTWAAAGTAGTPPASDVRAEQRAQSARRARAGATIATRATAVRRSRGQAR